MIHWRQLPTWSLRAWPVLALIPVALIHATALHVLSTQTPIVNKVAGMALQLLGGMLVLYSVNDNLGLFRAQSLTSTILAWFRDFPVVRESISLSGSASGMSSATAAMSATVHRAVSTIEERLAEIERVLEELRGQLQREVQAVNSRIDVTRNELQQQILGNSSNITDLSKRLEHAAVGGFKFQALGVLLAIYGAVTSVFA